MKGRYPDVARDLPHRHANRRALHAFENRATRVVLDRLEGDSRGALALLARESPERDRVALHQLAKGVTGGLERVIARGDAAVTQRNRDWG